MPTFSEETGKPHFVTSPLKLVFKYEEFKEEVTQHPFKNINHLVIGL